MLRRNSKRLMKQMKCLVIRRIGKSTINTEKTGCMVKSLKKPDNSNLLNDNIKVIQEVVQEKAFQKVISPIFLNLCLVEHVAHLVKVLLNLKVKILMLNWS